MLNAVAGWLGIACKDSSSQLVIINNDLPRHEPFKVHRGAIMSH